MTVVNKTIETFPDIPFGKFIGVSIGIFSVLGFLINALILAVILIAQKNRFTPYKYLMCHLAFSDFLCSIMLSLYAPLELSKHNWVYNVVYPCKLIYPLISCFTNTSTGTILLISLERYRGVMYPLRQQLGKKNLAIAFAIVWFVSIVVVLPNAITLRVTIYTNIDYCNEFWDEDVLVLRKIYGISFFAIAFAIPLLAIMFMHIRIMIKLRNPEICPDNMSSYQSRHNKRIMRVLTGIIIAFMICVSPNKILYFVWDLFPSLEKSMESHARYYMRTFQVLAYARVVCDPLIYCYFDKRFIKDLAKATKAVRGISFLDSKVERPRSVSQRTCRILTTQSRANGSFIGDSCEQNTQIEIPRQTAIMDSIPEVELKHTIESRMDVSLSQLPSAQRCRSETVVTDASSKNGSNSPIFNSLLSFQSEECVVQDSNVPC